ncbi:hypothetical protein Q2T46_11710 [Thermoanaerobacterium sp. CMT5567-10]|uniref:hypothetical protein n=1 Tax=Thermoanaerobacterium sp. CMT5567-10 TaxID=3061989 RepID=UPI0026E04B2C|nr:hypothetical protein [Thermoanaerobacterium sp. CMT5567-10]WKV08193.1 hypothetical protein Q2T46_11710 [Thermoanaerobacterium sp. CMT5567-10]
MPKIYAPNKEYTGYSAGVFFINGIGYTDNKWLIQWFKEQGYEVEVVKNDRPRKLKK